MTRVCQLWDLIEIWGFRKDIKNIKRINDDEDDSNNIEDKDNNNNKDDDNNKDDNNNKDNNNNKGISALGLDRDLGFSQGYQEYI